jgi:hypothetical protein
MHGAVVLGVNVAASAHWYVSVLNALLKLLLWQLMF